MTDGPLSADALLLELVRGQATTEANLKSLASRIDSMATAQTQTAERKDVEHDHLHARISEVATDLDNLKAWRDEFRGQLRGLLIGCVVGAGAVGGGAGAIVSSLLA